MPADFVPENERQTISRDEWKKIPSSQKSGDPGKGTARILKGDELVPINVEQPRRKGILWNITSP